MVTEEGPSNASIRRVKRSGHVGFGLPGYTASSFDDPQRRGSLGPSVSRSRACMVVYVLFRGLLLFVFGSSTAQGGSSTRPGLGQRGSCLAPGRDLGRHKCCPRACLPAISAMFGAGTKQESEEAAERATRRRRHGPGRTTGTRGVEVDTVDGLLFLPPRTALATARIRAAASSHHPAPFQRCNNNALNSPAW